MTKTQEAIRESLSAILASRPFHPLSEEMAVALEEELGKRGYLVSNHNSPLSPFAQGAIELAEMQHQLVEKGFEKEHAFELIRVIFEMNIKQMGL